MLQRRDVAPSHRIPLDQEFVQSIKSVADAMQWHDDVFIELAYEIMLGRPADPIGRQYYLTRLRHGRSRIAILDQLGKASEAKPRWEQISDLRSALASYGASRRPLAGLWQRLTDPETGTRPALCRARAMSNAIGRTRQDVLLACEALLAAQKRPNQSLSPGEAEPLPSNLPTMWNPRLRSVFDVREIDFHHNEKRVINALRI